MTTTRLTLYVDGVDQLARILSTATDVEVPLATFQLHGRIRHSAHVLIGDLGLTITDTGSVSHAELTIEVPDIASMKQRLDEVAPEPVSIHVLDGTPTLVVSIGAFSLFIVDDE